MPLNPFGLYHLSGALPVNQERVLIANGDTGTAQTINRLQELVSTGKRDWQIHKKVGELVFSCDKKDYTCYAERIFNFCRDEIQYVFDPVGVELIENPARILESGRADCDSIVGLLCAMYENAGFPCRFVTIRADKSRPDEYSHIYAQVKLPKEGWKAVDATMKKDFGWEAPGYKKTFWPATKEETEDHDTDEMAMLGDFEEESGVENASTLETEESVLCASCSPIKAVAQDTDFVVKQPSTLGDYGMGFLGSGLYDLGDLKSDVAALYAKVSRIPAVTSQTAWQKTYNPWIKKAIASGSAKDLTTAKQYLNSYIAKHGASSTTLSTMFSGKTFGIPNLALVGLGLVALYYFYKKGKVNA